MAGSWTSDQQCDRAAQELAEDDRFEKQNPGVQVVRLPSMFTPTIIISRPEHRSWCPMSESNDWPMYEEEECCCGLEDKRQSYDLKYRDPKANDLPEARMLKG